MKTLIALTIGAAVMTVAAITANALLFVAAVVATLATGFAFSIVE